MDYEVLEEYSIKNLSKIEEEEIQHELIKVNAGDVVFVVFCYLGVIVDILLVYIILHFRRLRTVVNIFLANICVADIFSFLVSPATFFWLEHTRHSLSTDFHCFFDDTRACCWLACQVFQTLMVIDWILENFCQNKDLKWKSCCKIVVVAVWSPVVFNFIVSVQVCYRYGPSYFNEILTVIYFIILTVFIIIVCIIRCVCACRKRTMVNNNGLIFVSVNVLVFYVGHVLVLFSDLIFSYSSYRISWKLFLQFLKSCLAFVNLSVLYTCDSEFRTYLKRVFKGNLQDDVGDWENMMDVYCQKCKEELM